MTRCVPVLTAASLFLLASGVEADAPQDLRQQMENCQEIREPEQRLACFDRLLEAPDAQASPSAADEERTSASREVSRMNLFWELDDQTHSGRGRIRTYKPLLAAPVRWSSRPNVQPSSPSGEAIDAFPLDSVESSLRLSLRTKLWDNPVGDNGDIWFAYTQTAFWQSYNSSESSPFRETNYMPEIFSVWRVGVPVTDRWTWEMVSLGLKHQSNGRGSVLGLSRSWNRLYANFGFTAENTEVYIRPWVRVFREDPDDNSDIEDFLGYGDLQIIRHFNGNRLEFTGRLNPSTGKGMAELGYHFPLVGDLHGYFSIFSGYGESLIDYNHRQTAVTAGFSLFQF
ncbi:MAG: phospholipase A [Wenzhouxiangella sp.]